MFPSVGMKTGSLSHVPDADRFVLTIGKNKLMLGLEQNAGDIIIVATACIYFPCLQGKKTVTGRYHFHRFASYNLNSILVICTIMIVLKANRSICRGMFS